MLEFAWRAFLDKAGKDALFRAKKKKLTKAVVKGAWVFQSYVALLFALQGGEKYRLLSFNKKENAVGGHWQKSIWNPFIYIINIGLSIKI